ncbi:MAG: hypothetical protein OK457_11025 [Thaumarchaeota archaeon]|nr:hypothetical protein [Nitrososphaerota archaeon]
MPVQDAEDVTIELSKINWEFLDLSYRFEWEDPNWIKAKSGDSDEALKRKKTLEEWSKKKSEYLASIVRRVKYEALQGRVVAKDHLGKVGFKAIYDMEPGAGLDVSYRVLSTKPSGEVRVTEDTVLTIVESDHSW